VLTGFFFIGMTGAVFSTVPLPWHIAIEPDTVYIGPPHCSASFIAHVTSVYKDKAITIMIDERTDGDWKGPGSLISGLLFDGKPSIPSKNPDYDTIVTILVVSPWEKPAGRYRVRVYAYPTDTDPYQGAYALLTVVIENTGVKTCDPNWTPPPPTPTPPPECTEGKVEVLQYCSDGVTWKVRRVCHNGQWVMETQGCPTQPPEDWWHYWYWWRWDWSWWRWPWVAQEAFDFALEATPATQSIKAGQPVTFTVNVMRLSGNPEPVTLSISEICCGSTYSFSLATGSPTFASALKVATPASLNPGTYSLTITGNGGGKTHSAVVTLEVAENKKESALTLSVSPSSLEVGEQASAGGALSPASTTTVELVYTRPDGFEMIKHVTTSAGAFSDSLTPEMPGLWSAKARWPGDTDHYGCESQLASFFVEATPEKPPSFWEQILVGLAVIAPFVIILVIVIAVVLLLRRRSKSRRAALSRLAKFCIKCGAMIPEGSDYCPKCGEKAQ